MNEIVDVGALRELKAFIQDRFPAIVEIYLRTSPDYIAAIEAGVVSKDPQAIADAAHPLKSSSGNLGLVGVLARCELIEASANAVIAGEESMDNLISIAGGLDRLYSESIVVLEAELD